MLSKRNIIVLTFWAILATTILSYCSGNKKHIPEYHSFLESSDFKSMSRTDQSKKCSTCHKQEYENETKGPHANAYRLLKEHAAFVNSKSYNCDFYTQKVNTHFNDCVSCHAPQDLFQTILKDTQNNPDLLIKSLVALSHPLPAKRMDETSRISSIDCMNCHYDGTNLISLHHISTKEDSNASLQTVERITKNNLTCYTCHYDVIRTINAPFAIQKTGSVMCVSCHQEYDNNGKGTHYFYWKHNPSDKVNKEFNSIIEDFQFQYTADKKSGTIVWTNTTIPHPMSPGPELIIVCTVMDKDSNVLGKKEIRINKKKEFDADQFETLGKHNLYGVEGNDVMVHGEKLNYPIDLTKPEDASMIKLSIIHKAQYWFPDSLGVVTATRINKVK